MIEYRQLWLQQPVVDVELAPVQLLEAMNGVAKWSDQNEDELLGGTTIKAVHVPPRNRKEVIKKHRARVLSAASLESPLLWIQQRKSKSSQRCRCVLP